MFENPTVKIFSYIGILILIFVLLDFLKLGQQPTLMEDNPITEAVGTRSSGTIRLSGVEFDGRSDWDLICLTGNGGEVRDEYRQFSFKGGAIQEESLWVYLYKIYAVSYGRRELYYMNFDERLYRSNVGDDVCSRYEEAFLKFESEEGRKIFSVETVK